VTHDELRALRDAAPKLYVGATLGPRGLEFYTAANPTAVLALLDDLARLRAAARAFAEQRTEAALLALWNEVER
jgi:hypothetical protein